MQVKTFEWQQVQAGKESTSKQLKEARLLADTLQKKVSSMQSEIDNCVYSPLHFQCISNACLVLQCTKRDLTSFGIGLE